MAIDRINLLTLTLRKKVQNDLTVPNTNAPVQDNNSVDSLNINGNNVDIFGNATDEQIEQAVKVLSSSLKLVSSNKIVSETEYLNTLKVTNNNNENAKNSTDINASETENMGNNTVEEISNNVYGNNFENAAAFINNVKEKIGSEISRAGIIALSQEEGEDNNNDFFGQIGRIFTQIDFDGNGYLENDELQSVLNEDLLSDKEKFNKYVNKYAKNIQNSYNRMSDDEKLEFIKTEAKLYLETVYSDIYGNSVNHINLEKLFENMEFSNDGAKYITQYGDENKKYITSSQSDSIKLDNSLKNANWYEAVTVLVKESVLSAKVKALSGKSSGYDDYLQVNISILDELKSNGKISQNDYDWYKSHLAVYVEEPWYINDKLIVESQEEKIKELKEKLEVLESKIQELNNKELEEFKANCVAQNPTGYRDFSIISEYVLEQMHNNGNLSEDEYAYYKDKVVTNPVIIKINDDGEKVWCKGDQIIESEEEIDKLKEKLYDLQKRMKLFINMTSEKIKENHFIKNDVYDYSCIDDTVLAKLKELEMLTEDEVTWYENNWAEKKDQKAGWYIKNGENYEYYVSKDETRTETELVNNLAELKTNIGKLKDFVNNANDFSDINKDSLYVLKYMDKISADEYNWYLTKWPYKDEEGDWYYKNGDFAGSYSTDKKVQEIEEKLTKLKDTIKDLADSCILTGADVNEDDYSSVDINVLSLLQQFNIIDVEKYAWYKSHWAIKKEATESEPAGWYIKTGESYEYVVNEEHTEHEEGIDSEHDHEHEYESAISLNIIENYEFYLAEGEEKRSSEELVNMLEALKAAIEDLNKDYYAEANQAVANYLDSIAGDTMTEYQLDYIGQALAVAEELEKNAGEEEAEKDKNNNPIKWQATA